MSEASLVTRKSRPLARVPKAEEPRNFVAFSLNREAFAVEIHFAKEILQLQELTQVPLMPPFVRGVINLRDSVVPVLDLSVRFGRPPTEVGRRTCIMILELPVAGKVISIGIIVDSVAEVMPLTPTDIEPAPSLGADPRAAFISGIAKVRGSFVILLDAARILAADEVSLLAPTPDPA